MFFNCNWCRSSCRRRSENNCCTDTCHKERDNKCDKEFSCNQERKCCHTDYKDYGYDNKNGYGRQDDRYYGFQDKENFGGYVNYNQGYDNNRQNYELEGRQSFNYYDQYGSFDKYENNNKDCKCDDKDDWNKPCKPYDDKKCYCKPYKYVCFPIDKY